MKKVYRFTILALCFLISACGPSAEQLTATLVAAQAQTQTAAPTITPTNTSTPEPTSTPPPTATSTPLAKIILKVKPENPDTYSESAGALSLVTKMSEFTDMANKVLKNGDPVPACPEIWIEAISDQKNPSYALFINGDPKDKEKAIVTAIYSTTPDVDSVVVNLGLVPVDENGNFVSYLVYQPVSGNPASSELEIQVILAGCEIFKEKVSWP